MVIEEAWSHQSTDFDFASFVVETPNMPLIKTDRLSIEHHAGDARETALAGLFFKGRVTSLVRYKGKPGQVLSLDSEDEAQWQVTQMQGLNPGGYRTGSCLEVPKLWAAVIEPNICTMRENGVERIVIADPEHNGVALEAGSENLTARYQSLAEALQMRYSEELKFFIREL